MLLVWGRDLPDDVGEPVTRIAPRAMMAEPAPCPHAWHRWTATWHGTPGDHELTCRATDAAGEQQPLEPVWNHGGYRVNAVQRIPVTVRPPV